MHTSPYARFQLNTLFDLSEIPDAVQITGYVDDTNPYIPKKDPAYRFRKDFIRDVRNFLQNPGGDGLFITGPTGSGKTSGITQMAARLNWPVQQITANARLELADLVGFHALTASAPGEVPSMKFQYGPLAIAMREGHILLINEIDLADPAEMAGLNDILEGRPLVIAQNGGEIIHPHPMFRIVVTGNSVGSGDSTGLYQGIMMQNLASMDRYRFIVVDYADPAVEKEILDKAVPKLPLPIKEGVIRIANDVRKLFVGNAADGQPLSITMSTRTLVRWCKLTVQFRGAPNALEFALNQALLIRAIPEDREAILRIAKDVFGDSWA